MITTEPRQELFTASGQDFDALKKAALSKGLQGLSI
jgi:hypothetical protein